MRCVLVVSVLVFALVSARPEGYSYFTPHGFGSGDGGSASSSASLLFTGGSSAVSFGGEVEDCEEPGHEHLPPFEHSQVHYFAPQVASHSGSSSSYQSAATGHQQQQQQHHSHSLPSVHAHLPVLSESSGSGLQHQHHHQQQQHHHQQQQQQQQHQTHEKQVHHHVEPQVEYYANVHQHQSHHQSQHHSHHAPAVHYVQQPVVKEEVHKHIYVHVAPEEKEEIHQKVILPTYTKQKHYKIIFIKAPSPPTVSKVVLPPQPLNEEKTLVYVLHKKPELEQEIVVPAPATSKPSKPEVYFIKYKTKKEEKHQQQQHHHSYEEHKPSGAFGSSSASDITAGFEASDLSGYSGGSFGGSFAPIVVTEGSYHHSTTPAPVKVTTVHSVLSSPAAPSAAYVSSTAGSIGHKSQSIKVSSVGLSGYSTGGSPQRGSKKACRKCSKTSSTPLPVHEASLDAFVSNVY